ncbi:hypothetical protein Nepgr_004580 [Nepenthes gracilis]|uniref:Uncharacterized protein n=1 Tax=Nepenthes gracilis TaxID=150966 RepID=A0AAD3S1M4_NEPGR|nr:hypothetical protein Nepgr_004580 [Nepenthes gracilis]
MDSSLRDADLMKMMEYLLPADAGRNRTRRCQHWKSWKSIEGIPHSYSFRYLFSKELSGGKSAQDGNSVDESGRSQPQATCNDPRMTMLTLVCSTSIPRHAGFLRRGLQKDCDSEVLGLFQQPNPKEKRLQYSMPTGKNGSGGDLVPCQEEIYNSS